MSMNSRSGRNDNVIRVRDALIEEIVQDRNAGYVTISYGEIGNFNMFHVKVVQLLVGQSTVIQNQFGQEILLRDLREGMSVDAEFSSAMTASEPPQARAFRIVVLKDKYSSHITIDRVIMVDVQNSYFITGKVSDINSQMHFNVTPATIILDRRGNRIYIGSIRAGQMVKVVYANYMTFSIPPQTTAYSVQLL